MDDVSHMSWVLYSSKACMCKGILCFHMESCSCFTQAPYYT